MGLTREQSERVKFLLDGGWGQAESEELPEYWTLFDRVFAEIETPEELHAFADRWNWDWGDKPILRVIVHPLCDRGTALMIYWRIDPIFYLDHEHNTRAKVQAKLWPDAVVLWDVLRDIERRLSVDDFRFSRVPFDPTNDRGRDRTKQRRKRPPLPLLEYRDGKCVQVGEENRPDYPEVDVRASLPAIVFQPVTSGSTVGE